MSLQSFAPLGTDRRLAFQLLRSATRDPSGLGRRISRENLAAWRRFHNTTVRCNICGHRGTLLHEMLDAETLRRHRIGLFRETLRCRRCCSKMRDRTLAAGLLKLMAEKHGVAVETISELAERMPVGVSVLDTDASGRIGRLLARCAGYTVSLLVPGEANGAPLGNGAVNVNLENIPFPDRTFDVILTTEVMEHVRYVDRAHSEIARCLTDGGTYLFTVPYDPLLAETWRLIDPDTDKQLVYPAHMHGDPGLRDEGIKSYRVFGRDIIADLRAAGLEGAFTPVELPENGIFAGDLFVAARL